MAKVIPPPPGFELDTLPAPPAGFVLTDTPAPPEGFVVNSGPPQGASGQPDDAPAWQAAPPPPSAFRRFLTAAREKLSPLLGPTEAQLLADGVTDEDGRIQYKPLGSKADQEGLFPALSHPMIPLPRMTAPKRSPQEMLNDPMWQMMSDVPLLTPETTAAAANTGAGFLEFAESPLGLATAGIGKLGTLANSAATPRAIAAGYAADMAAKVPEQARATGEVLATGTPQEQMEALAGLGVNVVLPGVLAGHAVAPRPGIKPSTPSPAPTKPKVFSEFGGEVAAPRAVTETAPAPVPAPPEGFVVNAPEPQAAQPISETVPEAPNTLLAQLDWLKRGKRPAVMLPADAEVPSWVADGERFATHETPAGKFVYDTTVLTKDQINQAIEQNKLGTVLGYGIEAKPADGTAVGTVVIRDKQGTEKQAVVTDAVNLPNVLKRAQELADEGDVVKLETPEEVIAGRQREIAPPAETEKQRMAREAVENMAEFRKQKEANKITEPEPIKEEGRKAGTEETPTESVPESLSSSLPPIEVLPRHLEEARAAVADLRGETSGRAPDIIDELEGAARTSQVQFPPDLAKVIDSSRERVAQALHQKPFQRLSRAQRQRIDQGLRVSTKEGREWDKALLDISDRYRDLSMDDFANAILDAGEARLLEKPKADSAEVKAMAEDIARAEAEAKAQQPADEQIADMERETGTESGDAVERWFDDAIEATSFGTDWTSRTSMGLAKIPIWLTQEAATIALRVAKLAYTSTRDLSRAISQAIDSLRKLDGFNEAEANAWMQEQLKGFNPTPGEGQAVRTFPAIVSQTGQFTPEVLAGLRDVFYTVQSDAARREAAIKLIEERGPEAAYDLYAQADARVMPDSYREFLGAQLAETFAKLERSADAKGERAEANKWIDYQQRVLNQSSREATAAGQTLQARKSWYATTPAAKLAEARTMFERFKQRTWERVKPAVDAAVDRLNTARKGAVEDLTQDPKANEVTRQAVDEGITTQADVVGTELHKAVVMELAEPWAQSEYILNTAREAVRAKANELLNNAPRPPGFTPAQHLRQILDDLAARSASIFASYIQGLATHKDGIVGLLQERLGLDKPSAQKLASSLSKGWDKHVEQAGKMKVLKQLARQRERQKRSAAQKAERKQAMEDRIKQSRSVRDRESEAAAQKLLKATTAPEATPGKPALQEFYQRLTANLRRLLPDTEATQKAKIQDIDLIREAFDNPEHYNEVWQRLATELRAKHGTEGMGAIEDTLGALTPDALVESQIGKVIRAELRATNIKLGDVAKQSAEGKTTTGQSLADAIVRTSGLTGDKAAALHRTLTQRFDALLQERAASELNKLTPSQRAQVSRKGVADKLMEAIHLGALDNETAYNLVREKLKLPVFTPELQREVLRRANEIDAVPADQAARRFKLEQELFEYLINQRGVDFFRDVLPGIFYSGMLSNPLTHGRNMVFTGIMGTADHFVSILHHAAKGDFGAANAIFDGAVRGLPRGAADAAEALRSGAVSKSGEKLEMPRAFPSYKFKGKFAPILNPVLFTLYKWQGRALVAEDLQWFRPNKEISWSLAARRVARDQGLRGKFLNEAVADMLADTKTRTEQAKAQAVTEGYAAGTLDYRRRVFEILDHSRDAKLPANTRENAVQAALRNTVNNEPYGVLGYLAKAYTEAATKAYDFTPALGIALDVIVPFRRIVANVLNESLNYTPVGNVRAWRSGKTGTLYGQPLLDADAAGHLHTKAIVGTLALLGIYALTQQKGDDGQPLVQVTGLGPADPNKRQMWKDAGNQSYHVKINGGPSFTYLNGPLGWPLAMLGSYQDAQRFKGLNEQDGTERLAYAFHAGMRAWLDQSFLSGTQDFLEMMSRDSATGGAERLTKGAARTVATAAIPNKGFLDFADRVFDPEKVDAPTVRAGLVAAVPFARHTLKPSIDALGQKITVGLLDNEYKWTKPDPLYVVLARQNAWPSTPERDIFVGDKDRGPDFYRALTPDERYEFIAESGANLRDRLNRELDRIAAMDEATAKATVQKIAREEREKVLARVRF